MKYRKFTTVFVVAFLLSLFIPHVLARDHHEFNDVLIPGRTSESQRLFEAVSGDSVHIEVESDIKVDIYVMSSTDWFFGYFGNSIKSYYDQTYTSFRADIPDNQDYYLIIHNPSYENARVDYSYQVESNETTKDLPYGMICIICGVAGIILLLVSGLILAIIMVTKSSKKKKTGYKKEIKDLEEKIGDMEKLGIDTRKERKLLAKYKKE